MSSTERREEAPIEVPEQLVESLLKLGIDTAFVLAPEHRPGGKSDDKGQGEDHIPLIDLSADKDTLVQEIKHASEEWGFFQVINHGVPPELLADLEQQAKNFFALPHEAKGQVSRKHDRPVGYFNTELTKNTRDWKEVFDFVVKDSFPQDFNLNFENQWPAGRSEFRSACENWAQAVESLSYRILELLALGLNLQRGYFHQFFKDDQSSFVRLNHYKKCPVPDLVLGVSRHKDRGAVTVLVQDDVGGLQVKRKDGNWIRVAARRDAFVINLGDVMQVWSNGKYESVEHRVVVNENRDRFSCPFFLFPSYKATLAPIPLLLNEDNRPRYRPFNWGQFDKSRKDSNFKHLGIENLQIHHFAI